MRLIQWDDLTEEQKREVKCSFFFGDFWRGKPLSEFIIWGREHAFYIRKDGKLSQKHNHCEPAYLADRGNTYV